MKECILCVLCVYDIHNTIKCLCNKYYGLDDLDARLVMLYILIYIEKILGNEDRDISPDTAVITNT